MSDGETADPMSARLRDLSTAVAVVLALAVVVHPVLNLVHRYGEDAGAARLLHEFGRDLIRLTPAMFYLCALWAVRGVFRALAEGGRPFGPALAQGLRGVGSNLAWGAAMNVVGSPLLLRWTENRGGFAFDHIPAAAAVGVVGLALLPLARLIERAGRLQNELDSII